MNIPSLSRQLKWQISPILEVLTVVKSKLGIIATRCPLHPAQETGFNSCKASQKQPGRRRRTLFKASNFLLSPRQRVRAAAFKKSPKLGPHFLSIQGTTQKYAHSLTFLVVFYDSSLDAPKTFLLFPVFTCFNHVPTVNLTPTHSSQNISSSTCA